MTFLAVRALCYRGLDFVTLRGAVAERLSRHLHADEFVFLALDPTSGFPVHAMETWPVEVCFAILEHAFLRSPAVDFGRSALYPQRAHMFEQLIGDERLADDPYLTKILKPFGYAHEAQVNFAAGGRAWGHLHFNRRTGREPFDERDLTLLEMIAPHVTAALRAARARAALEAGTEPEVGTVLLDTAGRIEVANRAADRWLSRPVGTGREGWIAVQAVASLLRVSLAEDVEDLIPILTLAGVDPGATYELRAERVRGTDGDPRTLVLIVPRRAADRTDVLQDLGLTPREAEVALAVLRGQSTATIARELALSPYTVQDHVHHACDKLGVRTRRELAALLFGNTMAPRIDPRTLDCATLTS
jgi:DNA-binding CsgD family transcriptional regulator